MTQGLHIGKPNGGLYMLLTMRYLEMLEPDGPEKFRARERLDDDQKVELREFDEAYFQCSREHIITNYQDLT
jgi:hypothetical protein